MNKQLLIERAERIFKTDIRYVGKNGFWVLLGQAIAAVSGLAITIAFANWLPQHEYGLYKYALALAGLLGALRLTGLQQAITQATARGFDATVLSAIRLSAKWSTVLLLIASIIAAYYFANDNYLLGLTILIAVITNIVIGSIGLYGGYLTGKHQFKKSAYHFSILTIGTTATTIASLYVTDNILMIVLANCVATIVILSILSYGVLRAVDRNTEVSEKSLHFGKHVSFQNVLIVGSTYFDKIVLFQLNGSIELARYAFSMVLPEQLATAAKSSINIIIPKYSTKNESALRKSIGRKIRQLTSLMIIPIIIYAICAHFLFSTLFPAYTDVVNLSILYTTGLVVLPANTLLMIYFNVREATKILYKIKFSSALGKSLLLFVGIFFFGIIGAIVAQIVARFLNLIILLWYYKKTIDVNRLVS